MSLKALRRFGADESGAVTVDWVALTAAVVVIGIGLAYAIFGGTDGNSGVGALVTNLTEELGTAATNIQGVVGDLPNPVGNGGGGDGGGGDGGDGGGT